MTMKDEAELTGDRQQAWLICISLLEALKLMTYVEGDANTPIALNAFQSELLAKFAEAISVFARHAPKMTIFQIES